MKKTVLGALVFLAVAGAAGGGWLWLQRPDPAIRVLQQSANQGDAKAQYQLALLMLDGKAIAKNEAIAQQMIESAAELQEPRALLARALLRLKVDDLQNAAQDAAKADTLFQAQTGRIDGDIAFLVGYLTDLGVVTGKSDAVTAFKWYESGVDSGSLLALTATADALLKGRGTERDFAKARIYLEAAQSRLGQVAFGIENRFLSEPRSREQSVAVSDRLSRRVADSVAQANLLFGQVLWEGQGGISDRKRALPALESAAQAGMIYAPLLVATALEKGDGIKADEAQALIWYQRAAQQGNPMAALMVGRYARDGRGGKQPNPAASLQWLEFAAQKNLSEAMVDIGTIHATGKGVPRDGVKAADWYQKAAKAGNRDAMAAMGEMLAAGRAVQRDDKAAIIWLQAAVKAGSVKAMVLLADMLEEGRGIERDPSEAARLIVQSAEAGYAPAQLRLGKRYLNGLGVVQDMSAAYGWLKRANDQGDTDAMVALGELSENGQGVPVDLALAKQFYEAAATRGNAAGQYHMANLYKGTSGVVPQDLVKAREWLSRAAQQQDAVSQYDLAQMQSNGDGGPRDLAAALKNYRGAAMQGLPEAQFALGDWYENGVLVDPNPLEAMFWYSLAEKYGAGKREFLSRVMTRKDNLRGSLTPEELKNAEKRVAVWQKTLP